MRSKCVLNKNNKNTNSDLRTQTQKLKERERERERARRQEIELRRWKIWILITEQDLGAKLFGIEIVRAIHVSKLFEKLQPSLAELLHHQNCRLCVQRARSFNDHHQGLRESPARTKSYKDSWAEWQFGRQWQRWRCKKIKDLPILKDWPLSLLSFAGFYFLLLHCFPLYDVVCLLGLQWHIWKGDLATCRFLKRKRVRKLFGLTEKFGKRE